MEAAARSDGPPFCVVGGALQGTRLIGNECNPNTGTKGRNQLVINKPGTSIANLVHTSMPGE
jgi:hypothetical protein